MHPAIKLRREQVLAKQPLTIGETTHADDKKKVVPSIPIKMLWFSYQRKPTPAMKKKIGSALELYDFSLRNPLMMSTKDIILHIWALDLYYKITKQLTYLLQGAYLANYVAINDHEDLTDICMISFDNSRRVAADRLTAFYRDTFRNHNNYLKFLRQSQLGKFMSMHQLWKLTHELLQKKWSDEVITISAQNIRNNIDNLVSEAAQLGVDITTP